MAACALLGLSPFATAEGDAAPTSTAPAPARWIERALPSVGCRVLCPEAWTTDDASEASEASAPLEQAGGKADREAATVVVRLGAPDGSVRASVRRLGGRRDLKAVVTGLAAAQSAAGWTAAEAPVRGLVAGYDAVSFTATIPAAGVGAPALTQRVSAINTHRACFVLTYGAEAARFQEASAGRFVESFTLSSASHVASKASEAPPAAKGADAAQDGPDPTPRYGCTKCDLDHPKTASYCARCGGPLGTLARWGCRPCRLVAPREDHFCTRCGHKLEPW